MRKQLAVLVASLTMAAGACSHSDSFATPLGERNGPVGAGADINLTYNSDQDYWPIWTQDGKGILYAFVDPSSVDHRCMGLLPAGGGTRQWQLCDNRASRADTISSFGGFALDSNGRLLLTEAVSRKNSGLAPLPTTTLWLTDTASPFIRTPLLTMPAILPTTVVNWLADIRWIDRNSFVALGQQFQTIEHCVKFLVGNDTAIQCLTKDTLFIEAGGVVVRGAITGNKASLQVIPGTDSATGYTIAEGGASIVFTVKREAQLYKIPFAGGTRVPVLAAPTGPSTEIFGVSCKGSTCVYARDSVILTGANERRASAISFANYFFDTGLVRPLGTMELHRVSLAGGADELLVSNLTHTVYATPQIAPLSGDVVVQVGGGWGHFQTFATVGTGGQILQVGNGALHLMKGIVP